MPLLPHRGARRCSIAARAAAMLLAVATSACSHDNVARPLSLSSRPVGFSRVHANADREGKLHFRGGVELTASDSAFGGLSGLLVSRDGASFVAISDEAQWVTGRLGYEDGNLARVTGTTIAPMLDRQGHPLPGEAGDAEGLTSVDGKDATDDFFVSFEGDHRLWRYPFAADGVRARPEDVPLPAEAHQAPKNGGLEGIVTLGDGLLLAQSERHRDRDGNYHAWLIRFAPATAPDAPQDRALALRPVDPFAITDVRLLPGGDLLTLERRYAAATGVGMQMRRIPRATLERAVRGQLDGPLDGEIVANLDANYRIDNMEGLSVRVGERGETLLYVVSDDNYNRPVQSTLLLMYELLP